MKKFFLIFLTLIVLISGLVFAEGIENDEYIETEGIVYPQNGQNLNDMQRIAIMEARRMLAEEIDALQITSTTTIKESRRVHDEINSKVESIIRGSKVISRFRDNDGAFHAVVRLQLYGNGRSIASAVLPINTKVEDFPKPKFTDMESGSFDQNYTGLIIDCRGLKLTNAIVPSIKSDTGVEIYNYNQIHYQTVINKGMVEYINNIEASSNRVGNNPLIIKAVKLLNKCDVVISQADSDKVLIANQYSKFLNNCMVAFLR